MVRFSWVWRALLRMGHPQVRWLVWLMTQDGLMPAQLQGDEGGSGALPRNRLECGSSLGALTLQRHLIHSRMCLYARVRSLLDLGSLWVLSADRGPRVRRLLRLWNFWW